MRKKHKRIIVISAVAVFVIILAVMLLVSGKDYSEKHVCSFTEWRTDKEPTCILGGEMTKSCIGCSEKETKILEPLGHAPDYENGEFVIGAATPVYRYKCSRDDCKKVFTEELTITETVTASTCIEKGNKETVYHVSVGGYEASHTVNTELELGAHVYSRDSAVWTWDGYTARECTLTCGVCNDHSITVSATTGERTVEATCGTQGRIVYTGSVTVDGIDYTADKIKLTGKLPHNYDYNAGVWTWNNGVATYTVTCQNDSHHTDSVTEEAELISHVLPTCDTDGSKSYEITVSLGGRSFSEEHVDIIPALGHNYDLDNPVWSFSETESYIVLTCLTDTEHTLRLDAVMTKTVNKEPTCDTAGSGAISAVVTYGDKEFKKVEIVSFAALGHEFDVNEGKWVWNEGHTAATFNVTCTRGEGHLIERPANVKHESELPTCDTDGYDLYVASLTISGIDISDEVVYYYDAEGHDYVVDGVEWIEGTSKYFVHVYFVCNKGEDHTDMAIAEAKILVKDVASCTKGGIYSHVATVEKDGKLYTVSKEVAVDKTGHSFVDGYCLDCSVPTYSEGLDYALLADGSGYAVTGIGSCTDSVISIPATYLGLPVKQIADGAFKNNAAITELYLCENIEKVGSEALAYCTSLLYVSFTDVYASIESYAFAYCTSLVELYIPANVYVLKDSAFKGCSSIEILSVASREICDGVFYGLDSLMTLEICDGVEIIGNAFATNGPVFSITIPSTVTSIGNNMFDSVRLVEVENLSSITITPDPESEYPFLRNLKNVYTATSGKSYLQYDFFSEFVYYITSTERILIGCMTCDDSVLTLPTSFNGKNYSIYAKAFYHLKNVEKVIISGKVSYIGTMAFSSSVTKIDIDENTSLMTIADGAFAGTAVTSIYIPASVDSIGANAFPETLVSAVFASTETWWIVDSDEVDPEVLASPEAAAAYLKENSEYVLIKTLG